MTTGGHGPGPTEGHGRGAIDALYGSTMHGERPAHPDRLMDFRPLDPDNRPAPFKRYSAPGRPLPTELRRSSPAAVEVLSGGGGGPTTTLDDGLLGTLLFLSGGVTRVAHMADREPTWFRAAMSAGNLHPVEIYVVRDGVHHYQPLEHALVPLRRPLTPGEPAAATLVLTGIPFRTCWKYGERGWRHLWWDAGCMLANLLAVAAAHGLPAEVSVAFPDAAVADLVGVDGVDEVPVALVRLGGGAHGLPPALSLTPITVEAGALAPHVLRFPLVVEAQAESCLGDEDVDAWRQAAREISAPAARAVEPPAQADAADRVEDVILRRGSTRLFRRQPAPGALLRWGLAAATRSPKFDSGPAGTVLEHLVNVHDVEGLDAGGYAYRPDATYEGRTRADDVRAYGARLCLDQPLGGDSAFTAFHAAQLEPLAARLGGRGHRAALLEAGLVAGRLALNAVALHCGATGLTFYDGLVSRYFRTAAAPLLATAVGIPDGDPAPSGTPGAPAELNGYARVMARMASRFGRR